MHPLEQTLNKKNFCVKIHFRKEVYFIMAKKGQKFRKFTDEERTEIVGKYISGKYGYKNLAEKYKISWKTVETMVRKYRTTGTTIAEHKGRPKEKNLTKEDWKERYEILKKYQAFLKAQRERK